MRFLVADVETTGLDATKDKLLEVAFLLLNEQWEEIDRIQFVVQHPHWLRDLTISKTDEYVVQMHTDNGLWDDVFGTDPHPNRTSRNFVDGRLAGWLLGHVDEMEEVRVIGNSLRLDLNFIEHHLPLVDQLISHRSIDVSAVESFLVYGLGLSKFERPKVSSHRAMDDVESCYHQLLHHRDSLRVVLDIADRVTREAGSW